MAGRTESFQMSERVRQGAFFSATLAGKNMYGNAPWRLHPDHRCFNLAPAIQKAAPRYMEQYRIAWHTHANKEALAVKLALAYLEKDDVKPVAAPDGSLQLGRVSLPPLEKRFGAYSALDAAGYQVLYEFQGPLRAPVFSVGDLVDGRIDAEKLRDRMVIVGTDAFTVKDSFTAPLELAGRRALPGAVLHGVLTIQLVAHALDDMRPTRPLAPPAELAIIVAACIAGGLIGMLLSTRIGLAIALASGGLSILAGCLAAFAAGLWLPVVPLVIGYLLSGVLAASSIAYVMRSQVNALKRLFSAHVSEEIATHVWRNRSEVMRNAASFPRG
jgi:adenylate cyclase